MPKQIYTRAQREHALYMIDQLDDIPTVSNMLGIPESTLRDWWRVFMIHADRRQLREHPNRHPAHAYTSPTADTPTLTDLRDNLLRQLHAITANPTDDPRQAYHTALAVRTLLDQIAKLNHALGLPPPSPDDDPDNPP